MGQQLRKDLTSGKARAKIRFEETARERQQKSLASTKARLISRDETAIILGNVSPRTIDKMLKKGELKAVRIGDRVMITAASVDALIGAAA